MRDYYKLLGLSRNADVNQIKKAYRLNAIKYHPDKNFGDNYFAEKFKEINEAYSTLIDPLKKADYDLIWDKTFDFTENKTNQKSSFSDSTTYKEDNKEEDSYKYNPHKPFYSFNDRFNQETPQFQPIFDHWGKELNSESDFFILPKNIGKIISGFTNLKKSDQSIKGYNAIINPLKGIIIGLCIGGVIILVAKIQKPIWITVTLFVPTLISGLGWWLSNKLSGYVNFIGVNGFAEYECNGERTTLIKNIEVNFNNITDLVSVSQIKKLNFVYSSTGYGFVWLNKEKIILEVNGQHESKENNPNHESEPEFWLHTNAEKYWTIYLLDNLEKNLQKDGCLKFNIAHFENDKYILKQYIKLGVGYIEFLTENGNVKYNYNEIKRIYRKGTTLQIEHINYQVKMLFIKSGNKDEIPLLNLTNRQFFFKALEILLGYNF